MAARRRHSLENAGSGNARNMHRWSAIRALVNSASALMALQYIRVRLVPFKLKYRTLLALEAMSTKVAFSLLRLTVRLGRIRRAVRSERLKDITLSVDLELTQLTVLAFKLSDTFEERRMTLPHVLHRVDQLTDLKVERVPHVLINLAGELPHTVPQGLCGGNHAAENAKSLANPDSHSQASDSVAATPSIGDVTGGPSSPDGQPARHNTTGKGV